MTSAAVDRYMELLGEYVRLGDEYTPDVEALLTQLDAAYWSLSPEEMVEVERRTMGELEGILDMPVERGAADA